jgi:hypothetical protein
MWVDAIMEIYHKSFEDLRITSRFQFRFYLRILTLILLAIDEVLVLTSNSLPIRPFLILRCRTNLTIQSCLFFMIPMSEKHLKHFCLRTRIYLYIFSSTQL